MGELVRSDFTLDARFQKESGVIFLSGIQALVRAVFEQRKLDESRGRNTGGFISGYRGSPLGGLDQMLWRERATLDALNVRFQPAVNEELAATAIWGSQQVGLFPGALVDGVFGLWYGKAPGLDRACDAIRHANAAGTSPQGGVLLVVGDDHGCKSSTLPSHSELALRDLGIPILNPANVQDVLDFSLFGWAMSRYSGCWSGLIALADTMDTSSTILVTPERVEFVQPAHSHDVHIATSRVALEQESLLHEIKVPLALEFARANGINRLISNPSQAKLGIVTTGKAHLDLRQALVELGFDDVTALQNAGIRLLKLGMSWPLDPAEIESFADALDTVLVVEEKRAFVEDELKSLLYGRQGPRIFGKRDENGETLLASTGELTVPEIARALARYLQNVPRPDYLDRLTAREAKLSVVEGQAKTDRLPMFCAGCPHNTSTRVPEGSRASAGIGCHYMAQWMDRQTSTYTQMGGEGINWLAQAPFTSEKHLFVNLGDGTYFHSGLLAIRQAVAAGVNVTYKVLFNDAVAMTGGQPLDGSMSVEQMVAQLQAEGVVQIEVVSDHPDELPRLPVKVSHRDKLDEVQRRFREIEGCSAIIYQQTCATELRRRRKRGLAVDPDVRVMINDAVCEGCGDCSVKSNCVAVEPLQTELGVKRRINQTTCNKDLSCVNGFCPAFVLVEGARLKKPVGLDVELAELRARAPQPILPDTSEPVNLLVAGVGGTGVVTVSALVGTAAHLDGKAASTQDMTGLAQKGGAVFGHIRIASDADSLHGSRIASGRADLLLACDLITGASKDALNLLDKASTLAVINTAVTPTAEFVLHQDADTHSAERFARIGESAQRVSSVDASRMTIRLLGSTATLNVFLLGFAYQQGVIPLSLAAMERAIELNGVAVDDNLKAFHFGRVAAWDETRLGIEVSNSSEWASVTPASESLDSVIATRVQLLRDYQNDALADKYQSLVRKVQVVEQKMLPDSERFTEAVARSYAKLLNYKDEYEVARLYTDGRWQKRLEEQFEPGFRMKFLLAPPLFGVRKRKFGSWMMLCFSVLARMKFLRGSRFDVFGYLPERRAEREAIAHFEAVVEELLGNLNRQNLSLAARIAALAEDVRGYGHVKEAASELWLDRERVLMAEFHEPPAPIMLFDPNRSGSRNAA